MGESPAVSRVASVVSGLVGWLRSFAGGGANRSSPRRDAPGRALQFSHVTDPWRSDEETPLLAAAAYVRSHCAELGLESEQVTGLTEKVSFAEPRQQAAQLRFGQQKELLDASTIIFNQTWLNVPVWQAAVTLTLKHNPLEVLMATSTLAAEVDAPLAAPEKIDAYRSLFALAAARREVGAEGMADKAEDVTVAGEEAGPAPADLLGCILGGATDVEEATSAPDAIRGRFFIYRYRPEERCPTTGAPTPPAEPGNASAAADGTVETPPPRGDPPALDLPAVDPAIAEGSWRLVAELTFRLDQARIGELNWRALIDVETDSVLRLEPLISGLNGLVFARDPITSTGDASLTPGQPSSVLNAHRTSVPLAHLDAPEGGMQALKGRFAWVTDVNPPSIDPPKQAAAKDFDFDARTNDFAAVNAYYHVDQFFTLVESLGFPAQSYFDNTRFPVRVDHRDLVNQPEDTVNAWCVGDGANGIAYAGYALNDLGDRTHPIGRACDSRVHFHELGGHGILYEHVGTANFGFAHSAGDSLSAIFHDPETKAPDRFRYAPWNPSNERRFDRKVEEGWGWGGAMDDTEYGSEQILATTLFRAYRAIGGDSADVAQRRFASRTMLYLILRAVSTLTPATNPASAEEFANALMTADLLDWTSEKLAGGAYGKVIRWAFEKQGLYQRPDGIDAAGAPPAVDVYIDDGRGGEYGYRAAYWDNGSIWNRLAADGGEAHQNPVPGRANFAYVRLRNRGSKAASNLKVRAFHQKPGAGTVWPNDFEPLQTAALALAGTLAPDKAQARVAGPFTWIPGAAAAGGDTLLMAATADGDPTNLDRFKAPESIAEGRLVPHDNNIGIRRMTFAAAASAASAGPPPPRPPAPSPPPPPAPKKRGFFARLFGR